MRLHLDRSAVICTAALSLVAAVAAVSPSTAWADDTLPAELPSAASLADAATTAAATEAVAATTAPEAAADTGVLPEPDAAPVVDAPETAPSDPPPATPSGDTAAQEPASMPDPVTPPASSGDITPITTDTAADTPPATAEPTSPPAVATVPGSSTPAPTSANINVSVRIGSPGDNGPVSQINVTGGSVTPLSTAPAPETIPATPAPSSGPQGAAAPSDPATTDASSDSWYWSWDCLGMAPISAISPQGSEASSFPSSWTWIWNCGDNSAQYQPETPTGYSQINTNIAIRVSSPGNDGSVTQVNVGAGLTIRVPTQAHDTPFPASPVNVPPSLETAPGTVWTEVAPLLGATPLVDTTDITAALVPGQASDAVAEPASATPFAAPVAPTAAPITPTSRLDARVGDVGAPRIPMTPVIRYTTPPTSAVDAAWRTASPASSVGPKAPARPPVAAPQPRAPREPASAPVIPVSGVSAGAASSGTGGSGSGLPLLLVLPFVAALLDLARRVALEHATWPSGHRRRVPDRPG